MVTSIIGIYVVLSKFYANQIDIVEKTLEDNEIQTDIILDEPKVDENTSYVSDNIYKEEQKEDEIINILLCGMDARNYETKSRSDTIILASYNKTQHTVKLVSFMRDSWVYLPERGWSRINAATAYGGTGLLINTINHNFDLDIQNYVQIKFDDFRKVIDILGGIDVELTKQEIRYINNKLHVEDKDWNNDIKAEPGIITLNGAQALWHCRNRSIGNSDFSRTDRQREVLEVIINKALKMNIPQAIKMVYEMSNYINTNIPITTIIDLGTDAIINKTLEVESTRIPFDGEYVFANKNGASVLEINIDENTNKLHEFIGYNIDTEENEDESDEGEPDKSTEQQSESKTEEEK